MRFFLWNIMLAVNWALLKGDLDLESLASGFVLGFVLLLILRGAFEETEYFHVVRKGIALAARFAWELVKANVSVARAVLFKRVDDIHPAFLGIQLDARTDAEIAVLANMITLTPGTLSLDVSSDRSVLYIHTLDVDDLEAVRKDVKEGLEKPLLEVTR